MLLEFEKHSFEVFGRKTAKKGGPRAGGAGVSIGRPSLTPPGPSPFPPRTARMQTVLYMVCKAALSYQPSLHYPAAPGSGFTHCLCSGSFYTAIKGDEQALVTGDI